MRRLRLPKTQEATPIRPPAKAADEFRLLHQNWNKAGTMSIATAAIRVLAGRDEASCKCRAPSERKKPAAGSLAMGFLEILLCCDYAGDLPDVSNAGTAGSTGKRKELSRYSGDVVGMAVICPTCQVGCSPATRPRNFPDLMRIGFKSGGKSTSGIFPQMT
jgi:hypothetical protein